MRLTKDMKDNLINIIENKLTPPINSEHIKQWQERLQDIIYDVCIPEFKKLTETYEYATRIRITHWGYRHFDLTPFFPTYYTVAFEEMFGKNSYQLHHFKIEDSKVPAFTELVTEIFAKDEEYKEFSDVLRNLKATIRSCSTDKQLATMYPEFVQYFNKAGIVQKAVANLPSVYGLPDALAKYGLNLAKTKEEMAEEIQEETKETIH